MATAMPFLGRNRDLARLDALRAATAPGESSGVLLMGPAGIGKTRLLQEHVRGVRLAGGRTRLISATASAASVPLGGLSEVLSGHRSPGQGHCSDGLFHEAVAALVAEATAPGRWVLAVDDLPRLDDASAAAIHQCVVLTGAAFVATARTGEALPAAFEALWHEGQLGLVALAPLADNTVDRLIGSAVDGPLDEWSRQRLVRLAGGNPLALRELLVSVQDSGWLSRVEGVWTLSEGFQSDLHLTTLVDQRLAKVEPKTRRALELVALAEPLPLDCLVRLAGPDTVDELFERALIVRDRVGDGRVRSSHPLFGEVLRAQIPPGRHRRLAAELLTVLSPQLRWGPDLLVRARLALAAEDSIEVGLLHTAARNARQVGDRALARRFIDAAQEATTADTAPADVAATALIDALLRFEAGGAPTEAIFGRALQQAGTDEEILAVLSEWSWAALFSTGPEAATAVMAAHRPLLTSRRCQLAAEAMTAMLIGYAGRWGAAREAARSLLGRLDARDPAELWLNVRTVLAMAAAFDGPADMALTNGAATQQLLDLQPVIPTSQAICGIVGGLYGVAQLQGFDAAAAGADELFRQSRSGDGHVEYAGVWPGVVANLAVSFGVITHATRQAAKDAVRLLRWRDHCELLSLAIGSGGLLAALGGELRTAAELLGRYDVEFRAKETKTTVLADRGWAWLAFQQGDIDHAVHWAEQARVASWDRADVALWAAPAAHDLVRFGRPDSAIDHLRETARRLRSPFGDALLAHAVALAEGDVDGLEDAGDQFCRIGASGLEAEVLLQAATLALPARATVLRRHAVRLVEGSRLRTPLVTAALETRERGGQGNHAKPTVKPAVKPTVTDDDQCSTVSLQRVGRSWLVSHGVTSVTVRHLVGLEYLAVLVANPGQEIRCATLTAGVDVGSVSSQAMLDPQARRQLEARSRAVLADIARARATDDEPGVIRLEDEVQAIAEQLRGGRGLNGRARAFIDPDERARTAVRKAIKRAFNELAEVHPQTAAYLSARVSTGSTCRFAVTPTAS
ncbi:MAG: AAA family ATPase [Acidimicrobiales bacterium]